MGYKIKSALKAERKQGFAAVKELLADPAWPKDRIFQYAKQNEQQFNQLDDADDATFVATMDKWRQQFPDAYRVFWWWRKSHEDAAKKSEEDGEAKKESCYGCFEVCQFIALPWSDDWEDDRKHLKPGVVPLITEAQIESGLDHKSIKRFVWICHNRDIYTEEDEISDRTGRKKAGDPKFLHYHVWIECRPKLPITTIARWFNVPESQVEVKHGRGAFLDCAEYSVHESPRAVEQHKTHYDDDEVHYSGIDFRKEINDLQAHRAKFGKRASEMSPADTMRMHVLVDGWTLRQCRMDDPLTYAKIRNGLPPLRLDYLLDSDPCPFRLNIYIEGPASLGKGAFSEYLAEAMFPNAEAPFFTVGGDERVTFDGYDGEPAIIWEDMRYEDFIERFTPHGTYRIFDPHPKKMAQQAKNSRVILTNALNIINGVQPYEVFISGLADAYKDKKGYAHKAEDENQAWRRFPMIICIREQDFDVLINQGFVNRDLRSIKTMKMYRHVTGSMKAIQETLEGKAREKILLNYGQPVLEAKKIIDDSHNAKISDPDLIPAEFADYGKAISEEEYLAQLRQKLRDNSREAAIKRSTELLMSVRWLWLSHSLTDRTYYWYCNHYYGDLQPINSQAAKEYVAFMCHHDYGMLSVYRSSCWQDKSIKDVTNEEFGSAFLYFWMWCCNADNVHAHIMDAPDEPLSADEARQLLADMGLELTDEVVTAPATDNTTFSPETIDWKEILWATPSNKPTSPGVGS